MQSQGFDLIVVTETWWGSSCDWNVGKGLHPVQERGQGGGIVLCVRQHLERIELCLGVDDEPMSHDKRADLVRVTLLWVFVASSGGGSE